MKTYKASTDIAAPAHQVWQALITGLQNDPTPFGIVRLDGDIIQNGRIKLWSEVAPSRAFALTVTQLNAPHEMVCRGGMPFGLFTGTRTFKSVQQNDKTTFTMEEVFTGPLSGLITKSMPDLTPSFEKFVKALKEKAQTHE